eukprot:6457465-Amphidinium_carterae.2
MCDSAWPPSRQGTLTRMGCGACQQSLPYTLAGTSGLRELIGRLRLVCEPSTDVGTIGLRADVGRLPLEACCEPVRSPARSPLELLRRGCKMAPWVWRRLSLGDGVGL